MLTSRNSKALLCVALFGISVTIGAVYALAHVVYVPSEPPAISRRFIDLVQAGDLPTAYLLTDRRGGVGTTLAAFDANVRRQLGIDTFPTHRDVQIIGVVSGPQTYGNRLRRWVLGRKLDPDQITIDYLVGLPFKIRFTLHDGEWRIDYFESHAM